MSRLRPHVRGLGAWFVDTVVPGVSKRRPRAVAIAAGGEIGEYQAASIAIGQAARRAAGERAGARAAGVRGAPRRLTARRVVALSFPWGWYVGCPASSSSAWPWAGFSS